MSITYLNQLKLSDNDNASPTNYEMLIEQGSILGKKSFAKYFRNSPIEYIIHFYNRIAIYTSDEYEIVSNNEFVLNPVFIRDLIIRRNACQLFVIASLNNRHCISDEDWDDFNVIFLRYITDNSIFLTPHQPNDDETFDEYLIAPCQNRATWIYHVDKTLLDDVEPISEDTIDELSDNPPPRDEWYKYVLPLTRDYLDQIKIINPTQ
jgi:hypothetical protein